jgi:hypothetical protein
VIIAGIHQHGTWIAATFLDRLLHGAKLGLADAHREAFFADKECIAVIEGLFDASTFKVGHPTVLSDHFWQRSSQNDPWQRLWRDA